MSKIITITLILLACIFQPVFHALGQEYTGSAYYNPSLTGKKATTTTVKSAKKTTASLSLPFFEDFTGYDVYPGSNQWVDYQVYINNTMGVNPISRGVATFDALNHLGIPYDSFSNTNFRYADSLTSRPIDISSFTAGDSLYLSFFYQPQGNGFYPLFQDSLTLYLKTNYSSGGYVKVWSAEGKSLAPFQQVMIPITDTIFMGNPEFQFRFVNIAALYWADAIWNVDYIRMDAHRSMYDTAVNDIAFANNPSFLLNDYTSMPYRQFMAYKAGETALQYVNTLRNSQPVSDVVSYGFTATALNTGALLQSTTFNAATLAPASIQPITNAAYTTTIPMTAVGRHDKVVFENKYFLEAAAGTGKAVNDTIVKNIVFDNYLAYDDGSAEKSYYLSLSPTLPGKIAIEYHLNQPDTMRGMAIYFGRQIPFSTYKSFSMIVYSELAGVNGSVADNILMVQHLNSPMYVDSINHFTVYKFENPLPLPTGTFFAGTLQAQSSGNDSIYFGLDVNRVGGNHAYYNVNNSWNPSLISGAIMMRPLLGQAVTGSGINDLQAQGSNWHVSPNPAHDIVQFFYEGDSKPGYRITDIQGKTVQEGKAPKDKTINIAQLVPGMYFVSLASEGIPATPQKIIKL